jgi:hypothetical protein
MIAVIATMLVTAAVGQPRHSLPPLSLCDGGNFTIRLIIQ